MELRDIKGVGTQLEKKLNNLNIYNVEDLLEFYPYRYNYINIIKLQDVVDNENCMIKANIVDSPRVQYIKKNFNRLNFKVISEERLINVTIFNRAFLKQNLLIGKEIVLVGKYNSLKSTFVASDIKFNLNDNTIEPVYHLVEGIKNSNIIKIMNEALSYNNIYDNIPNEFSNKYNFITKSNAIKKIHKPLSINDIKEASKRLKYEELFNFMFKINCLKNFNSKATGIKRDISE